MRAELKAEAVRHGMVDLDGLKLIDTDGLTLTDNGEVAGAAGAMARLKRSKPWLFGSPNSSSSAAPPPSAPPRQKTALEMNDDEYRRARGRAAEAQSIASDRPDWIGQGVNWRPRCVPELHRPQLRAIGPVLAPSARLRRRGLLAAHHCRDGW